MLAERGLTLADCDAVCVSMGPGSYTGLRVGVSTAKGLCFGAGKPLLAVGTLDTLVAQAMKEIPGQAGNDGQTVIPCNPGNGNPGNVIPGNAIHDNGIPGNGNPGNVIPDLIGDPRFIIPMIDARRMEVYTAVFTSTPSVIPSEAEGSLRYVQITETAPVIIDENSFAEYLEQGPVLFIGDGAGKCADVIRHPNAHFCQCHPKASSMLAPAIVQLRAGNFQDVAYFEPFYLKEFVATVSKKKLW